MTAINAIFRHGVFQPLEPVDLKENQEVRISVEPTAKPDARQWLQQVDKLRNELREKYGIFPDSTSDIAEDRLR